MLWVVRRAYLLVWQKEGALCVERLPVFHLPPTYFPLFISVMGACLLGPAIGAVSILELATNSRS